MKKKIENRKQSNPQVDGVLRKNQGTLLVSMVLVGALLCLGPPPAFAIVGDNVTQLQNEKIAVFGSSWSMEPYPTHLSLILDREVKSFIYGSTGSEGAIELCAIFNEPENKFGIIVVDFGSHDWYIRMPWNETDKNLRELFQRLKQTESVIVYNQLVPDTYQGYGHYYEYSPYSKLVLEEGVILVPNTSKGIGAPNALNPHFIHGDPIHPIRVGFILMAERTAKVLRDTGLVKWADTWANLSIDAPGLLSKAQDLITQLEAKGVNTTYARWRLELTQYLNDDESYYTMKWQIENELITPLTAMLDHWGEIQAMFVQANQTIKTLEEEGRTRDLLQSKPDYERAEEHWGQYDYEETKNSLQRIIDRVPEPRLAALLFLIVLKVLRLRIPNPIK